jgi:hypothetical protein
VTQLWARRLPSAGERLQGTLRSLVPLTAMVELLLDYTAVTGDLADLAGMTQLAALYLDFTAVTGDLADLEGMTELTTSDLELIGAPVHGDADALRKAIPGLSVCPAPPPPRGCALDTVWGTGDGASNAFTTCTFLPCGTTVSCVTDSSNPFGVCGAGCSTADETTLGAVTALEDLDPTQLTAECFACIQHRGREMEMALRQSGHDNSKTVPFPEQMSALLGLCGLGAYRLPADTMTQCIVVASDRSTAGAPPTPTPTQPGDEFACSTVTELDAALDLVNQACCDEPTEDCSSGYPAT